jgi:hypothetical protein
MDTVEEASESTLSDSQNSQSTERLVQNTSTDESPSFPAPNVTISKVMPSLGPRRISLKTGAVRHSHSENNHT